MFAELVGQVHVSLILQNAIKSGRLVHSYLFTGPRGIGKTTVARLLAKAANCTGRQDGGHEPCNECENCRAMNAGNAMNVIEIDAASNTGVDNVREKIIENVRFAPSGSRFRIFIIDEAHMLSSSAWNALLKTLEEPPGHTIFILATTELHKVPATIISRCQRFDFKNFTAKEIVGRLQHLAEVEGVKVEKSVLERIAYLAEGGLRDAESLLGQLLSLELKEIGENEADLLFPKSDIILALKFLGFLTEKNGREAMLLLDELQNKGVDYKYFINEILELSRHLLRQKLTGAAHEFFTSDINAGLAASSASSTLAEIIKILDTLVARRAELNSLDVPSLPLELAIAEICGEAQEIHNAEYGMRNTTVIPDAEGIIGNPVNGTGIQPPTGDLLEIIDKWPEVLERIKDYNHSLPFILGSSKPIAFDGRNLTLAIKFKLHKEKLDDQKSRAVLTEVLKSVYNKDIFVASIVDETLPGAALSDEEISAEQAFG